MGTSHELTLLALKNPFISKYNTLPEVAVRKKSGFTAHKLIHTIFHLSTSSKGCDHSLEAVFDDLELVPFRSSLSKSRNRISYQYFADHLKNTSKFLEHHRPTYGNLGIYAIDGHQLTLPFTKDLFDKGYNGRQLENDTETHTLKAYVGHCCNVLSQTTVSVTFNPTLNEHRDRPILLESVPDKSLVIYDRLYLSLELVADHMGRNKVYFLARCKRNSSSEIAEFFDSGKEMQITQTLGSTLLLLRIRHPISQEQSVMATNLPDSWLEQDHIANLYKMRWEVEIFQKDFMTTAHGNIWHARTANGILQEFYSKLMLINVTKALMALSGEKIKDVNQKIYFKSNFSLCFNIVRGNLKLWFQGPTKLMIRLIRSIKRTREKRRKNSRSYPRVIKSPASKYTYDNTVPSKNRPPPKR